MRCWSLTPAGTKPSPAWMVTPPILLDSLSPCLPQRHLEGVGDHMAGTHLTACATLLKEIWGFVSFLEIRLLTIISSGCYFHTIKCQLWWLWWRFHCHKKFYYICHRFHWEAVLPDSTIAIIYNENFNIGNYKDYQPATIDVWNANKLSLISILDWLIFLFGRNNLCRLTIRGCSHNFT